MVGLEHTHSICTHVKNLYVHVLHYENLLNNGPWGMWLLKSLIESPTWWPVDLFTNMV